jgi:hypothetical protein
MELFNNGCGENYVTNESCLDDKELQIILDFGI